MAEPLGLVPRGAEGTGAAQIFRPFDSSGIFNAYDRQTANLNATLKNSFDEPVSKETGFVHPNDQPYIKEARDKFLNRKTQIYSEVMSRRRQPTPEEMAELTNLRQEVVDRVSLAQNMYKNYNEQKKLRDVTPWAYTSESKAAFDTYWDTPFNKRTLFPELSKVPETDFSKWIGDIGNPTIKRKVKVTNADGTGSETEVVEFDPVKAEQAYKTQFLPMLQTTQQGLALSDIIRNDLIKQDPNYMTYSPDKQAEIFDMAAKNYYLTTKKNQYQYSRSTVTDNTPAKTSGGTGGSSKVNRESMQPVVGRAYVIYDPKTGKRKYKEGNIEKGEDLMNTEFISVPVVFNENTPTENKQFTFTHYGKPVTGSPQSIRKYKVGDKWEKNYSIIVATKDKYGVEAFVEIPFAGDNKQKLEKEFGFSIDELINKYGNLEQKAEEFPESELESMPGWDRLSPASQEIYRNAKARRKKTTPATNYVKEYGRKK